MPETVVIRLVLTSACNDDQAGYIKTDLLSKVDNLQESEVTVECIEVVTPAEDEAGRRRLLQVYADAATVTLTGVATDIISSVGAAIAGGDLSGVNVDSTLAGFVGNVFRNLYKATTTLLLVPPVETTPASTIRMDITAALQQLDFKHVTVTEDDTSSFINARLEVDFNVWFNVIDDGEASERIADVNYQIGRILDALSRVDGVVLTALPTVTLDSAELDIQLGKPLALFPPYDPASDFTDQGLEVTYRTDLAQLKQCKDWLGDQAVQVHRLPTRTEYILAMAVTFVSPQHPGDTSHLKYRSVCRDAKYKLGVDSEMAALTSFDLGAGPGGDGGSGGGFEDEVYLASSGYIDCADDSKFAEDSDVFKCSDSIGPQYKCEDNVTSAKVAQRRLEYVVHMDLALDTRTAGRTIRYQVSTPEDIAMPSGSDCGGNCYETKAVQTVPSSNHIGFHRTAVTFRTSCMAIQSSSTVKPVADAFATCKDCPSDATNFGFDATLEACVQDECYKMPNKYAVTVAMSHTEQSDTLEWSVENDMLFTVQTDFKHDIPSTDMTAATEYYNPSEILEWRNNSGLVPGADGVLRVSDKDILVLGLGFGEGASASEVMVGTTRTARLGRFKKHCHHKVFEANNMFLMNHVGVDAEEKTIEEKTMNATTRIR